MTQKRIAIAACAVLCLTFGGVAAHADATRTNEAGRFMLANMAPPEPEEPAAAPATPPTEGAAPAENAPAEPAAETVPAETAPPAEATADVAAEAPVADTAPSGSTPWLWIALGAAVVGALGFGVWWRGVRG